MASTTHKVWGIVTDHPKIFKAHIVPKLNGNDVKFFYDVNRESRAAIQRSGTRFLIPSRLEILTRSRPYFGVWRSVLDGRNDFVHIRP